MKYLKSFLIGSSYFVTLPFFYTVQMNQPKKNYSYFFYTLIAPIWFGLWNMVSLWMGEKYHFTLKMRIFIISIISSLSIMIFATNYNSYDFIYKEWIRYYIYIFIKYMLSWNIIIYNLENMMM